MSGKRALREIAQQYVRAAITRRHSLDKTLYAACIPRRQLDKSWVAAVCRFRIQRKNNTIKLLSFWGRHTAATHDLSSCRRGIQAAYNALSSGWRVVVAKHTYCCAMSQKGAFVRHRLTMFTSRYLIPKLLQRLELSFLHLEPKRPTPRRMNLLTDSSSPSCTLSQND